LDERQPVNFDSSTAATGQLSHVGSTREFTTFLFGSLGLAVAIYGGVNGITSQTVGAIAIAAMIGVFYWLMGRRAFVRRDERLGFQFLLIAFVLAGVLFQINSVFMTTCFGLYPLCFVLVQKYRLQLIAAALLSLAAALGQASDSHWERNGWVAGALIGGISFFFAIVMGSWVGKLKDVTERQEQLIAELTSTRAQLSQAQHEAGVRDERERLSAEIHDTLAQGFSSILMLSRSAERSTSTERTQTLLKSISECAQTNVDEARSLVENLAPPALQDGSLSEAVTRLASKFQTESGVLTTLVTHHPLSGQNPLTSAEQVVLLRALQESLTNVGRHAAATTAQILLHLDTSPVAFTVVDDGVGFDAENDLAAGHHGLSGIRNRLAQVGGSMSVASKPGTGTEVTVRL
jgi:signal transduction histidine kinase